MTRDCRRCGRGFEVPPRTSRGRHPAYCSDRCRDLARKLAKLGRVRVPKAGVLKRPGDDWGEREYSEDEISFMLAVDRYKRENGRPYPDWREILQISHALGWRKVVAP